MKENTLGDNIKAIRLSLGLSQSDFAQKLNVGRTTIGHWETNYSSPSIPMLKNIKKTFNVTYDEIIDGV
ncbi:MAG: helix-turn-helix transcriptional regulator [Clostridiales bacterium]|nr:helix-turn-helix transcriptional regulator [Clostridiales bacterium]